MKNYRKIVVVLAMVMVFGLALASCGKKDAAPSDSGTVGDYDVTIKSAELLQDQEVGDVLAVTLETNYNGDEEEMVSLSLEVVAQQGDSELEYEPMFDDDFNSIDTFILGSAIPGETQEFVQTFALEDSKTPVLVTVSNLWDEKDTVLEQTFELE